MTDTVRIGVRVADDDVVHEFDVDHLGGFTELPGLWEATDYGKWTPVLLHRKA